MRRPPGAVYHLVFAYCHSNLRVLHLTCEFSEPPDGTAAVVTVVHSVFMSLSYVHRCRKAFSDGVGVAPFTLSSF